MTRLVVVSPVRNEHEHLAPVVAAMRAQTRRPDTWVIADDASTDGTEDLARTLVADLPWARVVAVPQNAARAIDGLEAAAEARAFLWALGEAGGDWDVLGKLDGDMVLDPRHYEALLAALDADPHLGVIGCFYDERRRGRRVTTAMPSYHVNGALKTWRRECWDAIGGITPKLGWDTLDETAARMRGWRTMSLRDPRALHLRAAGSATGAMRGRARHGACVWIANYPPEIVLARAIRVAAKPPYVIGGAAFALGWARAAARRPWRPADPELLRFSRAEQRARIRSVLLGRIGRVLGI